MNILKTFVAASAIALASFSASAVDITSGGITWNPDFVSGYGNDFISNTLYTAYDDSGVISGYGDVLLLNGYAAADYCAYGSDCQLSFVFSDLENGGTLNFYVNDAGLATGYDDAKLGTLWLSLAAVNVDETPDTYSDDFDVYFDAVDEAGTVFSNFDTNTMENGTDVAVVAAMLRDGIGGSATFYGDSIPEPTTLAIFGLGLLGLARMRKY